MRAHAPSQDAPETENESRGETPPVPPRRLARIVGWVPRAWQFFITQSFSSLTRRIVFLNVAGLLALSIGINFLSGSCLFTTQAAEYVVHTIFMVKMALVVLGGITAAILQNIVAQESAGWAPNVAPTKVQVIAWLSIIFWVTAIVCGRLTAYI